MLAETGEETRNPWDAAPLLPVPTSISDGWLTSRRGATEHWLASETAADELLLSDLHRRRAHTSATYIAADLAWRRSGAQLTAGGRAHTLKWYWFPSVGTASSSFWESISLVSGFLYRRAALGHRGVRSTTFEVLTRTALSSTVDNLGSSHASHPGGAGV